MAEQGLGLHLQPLVQMAKPEAHLNVELMATPPESPLGKAMYWASKLVMHLAQAMREQPPVMPQQNSPEKAIQLVWQLATPELAKERPLRDPGSRQTELRLPQAKRQDLRLLPVEDSLVPSARVRRYLRGPGPCAFSRETPAARKCNRDGALRRSPHFRSISSAE